MSASIVSADVDPLFLKAITLLRSKHPDSTKQLKDLVQEYRVKTYGSSNCKKPGDNPLVESKTSLALKSGKLAGNNVLGKTQKEKPEPSLFEKLEEINSDENSNQSTTMESIEEITIGSSLEPKQKKQKVVEEFVSGMSPSSDIEENDSIPIDAIIEMDFDEPMCKICHLNKREEENSLVECSECHSHYHQKCHKPNVSTKDLNDPRLIWYCSKCTKKMKKEMAAQLSSTTKAINTTATVAPKVNPFQQAKPFRRHVSTSQETNKVVSSSIASAGGASQSDLLSSPIDSASSREGSPISNKRPRDVAVNSMKRLELMKKNAKLQQQLRQTRK